MSETVSKETYTGKLNVCLDCDYYTTIDKGAEEHSRAMKHFVFQDQVKDKPLGREAVERQRVSLKKPVGG
jgi:hypothetical protein